MHTRIVFLVLIIVNVYALPQYRRRLPNPDVGDPCSPLGHKNCIPRFQTINHFAKDFRAAGYTYTKDFCEKDSDGDGVSNGAELGDPCCIWKLGDVATRTTDISHPGLNTSKPALGTEITCRSKQSRSPSPSQSSSSTPSQTSSPTPSQSRSPFPSQSSSSTPSQTSSPTPSRSSSPMNSRTLSQGPTQTPSSIPAPSPSSAPARTSSPTPAPTSSPTPEPTSSSTPARSSSPTPSSTRSSSPTPVRRFSSNIGNLPSNIPKPSEFRISDHLPSYTPSPIPNSSESPKIVPTPAPDSGKKATNVTSPPAVAQGPGFAEITFGTTTPRASRLCFPADAQVVLEDGTTKTMEQLEIGDRVTVGREKFSEVFAFTHRHSSVTQRMVELNTSSGASIVLSEGHYLYVEDRTIRAGDVSVGDLLNLVDGTTSKVISIREVSKRGLYNPQTRHGNIVIGGVIASTYTDAFHSRAAHAALSPLRALDVWFGKNFLMLGLDSNH